MLDYSWRELNKLHPVAMFRIEVMLSDPATRCKSQVASKIFLVYLVYLIKASRISIESMLIVRRASVIPSCGIEISLLPGLIDLNQPSDVIALRR